MESPSLRVGYREYRAASGFSQLRQAILYAHLTGREASAAVARATTAIAEARVVSLSVFARNVETVMFAEQRNVVEKA